MLPAWRCSLAPLARLKPRLARAVASETPLPAAPKLSISPLEIARLPLLRFPGRVVVISGAEEEQRVAPLLSGEALLGFDSESRPSSALAPKNRSAVIQIASEHAACLWRVGDMKSLPPLLRKLIEDPAIHKVSQGAVHEVAALKEEWGVSPQSFIDLHHIALHLRTTPRSLQGLAALFLQKRLSKEQRLTDWEQSPLSQAQIEYAAADAWSSRQVLVEMRRAFLCERLQCERLLGATAVARPAAAASFTPAAASSGPLGGTMRATQPSRSEEANAGGDAPMARKQETASSAAPPPPAEAHRELAAFCVANGYVLRFDGFESLPSGFRCVFRVEFRCNGENVSEAFRSKRVHAAIRAAQNDAASEALARLRSLTTDPG